MKETSARDAWYDFMNGLDAIRNRLGCSVRSAWYRGMPRSYRLIPALFRKRCDSLDCNCCQFFLNPRASQINDEIDAISLHQKSIRIEINKAGKEKDYKHREKLINKLNNAHREKSFLKLERDAIPSGRRNREREFFERYRLLSGIHHHNSWETLTTMRHIGIPTRLLDWTESLNTSLFFALEELRTLYFKFRCSGFTKFVDALSRHLNVDSNDIPEAIQEKFVSSCGLPMQPVIWITNPYRLTREEWDERQNQKKTWEQYTQEIKYAVNSRKIELEAAKKNMQEGPSGKDGRNLKKQIKIATIKYNTARDNLKKKTKLSTFAHQASTKFDQSNNTRIYDLTRFKELDYAEAFLGEDEPNWPFNYPIPMYAPLSSDRLFSQSARFTVHGRTGLPMELLNTKNCLDYVEVPLLAAIYGVIHLQSHGVNYYTVFRDVDSLGKTIIEELGF